MKSGKENPESNKMPVGLSESALLSSIEKSGFPLQTLIAEKLRNEFEVFEEWTYKDSETNTLRAIDILARKILYDPANDYRVRPHLDILIECKKHELPYVFFLSKGKPRYPFFPLYSGLPHEKIWIVSNGKFGVSGFLIPRALDLSDHDFRKQPPTCYSFSKAVRKNSAIDLIGEEPFNAIVLPLLKSMAYLKKQENPPNTAKYFDLHLILGIAILDAPMIGVETNEKDVDLTQLPWIRVTRHENVEERSSGIQRLFAIDVVHKDFFQTYLQNHLFPFALEFSRRCLRHQRILLEGKGFMKDLHQQGYSDIENRLKPTSRTVPVSRLETMQ